MCVLNTRCARTNRLVKRGDRLQRWLHRRLHRVFAVLGAVTQNASHVWWHVIHRQRTSRLQSIRYSTSGCSAQQVALPDADRVLCQILK